MSDQNIDLDSEEFESAPRALRDYAKKLQRQLTETAKERDTFKDRATEQVLGDVLKDFKNPKRVQRDLSRDGIDPLDTEAVATWLEENGEDYAKGEGSTTQSQTPTSDPDAAAHQRIAGADLASPAGMSRLDAALAEVTPDMSPEQVIAVYRKHGV